MQAAFDCGEVALPDARPPWLHERTWRILTSHLRERVPYAALARELGVSKVAVGGLARRAAERLRHPEVAHLPAPLRGALVAGGYTTRAALDAADDEALLPLPGVTPSALWRLRRGR